MTTMDQPIELATAAASGASATERFHSDKSPYAAVRDTPPERVDMLAREVLHGMHDTIRRHRVSYNEYNALKAWLIDVGETGEWPLFLDVWVEHVIEDVATDHRHGNKGTIEGPYYVPNAPEHGPRGTIAMRPDEVGTKLIWKGRITSTDGTPLQGKVELWHADNEGFIRSSLQAFRSGTCVVASRPVLTAASRSPLFAQRRTRFPRTVLVES